MGPKSEAANYRVPVFFEVRAESREAAQRMVCDSLYGIDDWGMGTFGEGDDGEPVGVNPLHVCLGNLGEIEEL